MHNVVAPKQESLTLVIDAPKLRARYVGRQRNGGGIHQDQRRRNDRREIKRRLRRGEW